MCAKPQTRGSIEGYMLASSPFHSDARLRWSGLLLLALTTNCGDGNDTNTESGEWQLVVEDAPGALLSVWGNAADDVWVVGADARDGTGPTVKHYDGSRWVTLDTGQPEGTLWWVFGFENGPVFMGGAGGLVLRYEEGQFTRIQTPSAATVFGIWGKSPDEVWAVGGDSESQGGFVWRLDDDSFEPEATFPEGVAERAAVWKVFGGSSDDVWFVGSNGVALHWDGNELAAEDTGVGSSLFTVHGDGDEYVAVGGLVTGIIVEFDGQWRDVTPDPAPFGLSGVCVADDLAVAVGSYAGVLVRQGGRWVEQDLDLDVEQNLHGVWIDPEGEVWTVGGQTFSEPFTDGVLVHRGQEIATEGW